jgi:predicted dehydrogenase/threonine dehydrogenase-like Zn-dependent dehydrogenase
VKQVLIKKGKAYTDDVPAPMVNKDSILVKVYYSCISAGTEISSLMSSGNSKIKDVLSDPNKVVKAIDHVKKEGLSRTIQKAQGKFEEAEQIGYSASGVAIKIGDNIKDIKVNEKVACAGAGIANHAEYIEVPGNLLVKIPDDVDFDSASTVALGAIALQGVRRANVTLGEYVAVIGLGILGQITVQLLKANGCRVIGVDLDERRLQKALELGMNKGTNPENDDILKIATSFSNGYGIDAVIITAATNSKAPLAQAFQMCRKKGRVVLVGVVGMEINREDMYKKELDFLIATSYGPGRYDEQYEQKGIDYPYAYVRWTENRNMEEYLKLIADQKINIKPLIEQEYKIEDAPLAYEELMTSETKPLITLLKYKQEEEQPARKVAVQSKPIERNGTINVAIVGAGRFAKETHLPNLMKLKNIYNIHAIMSKTGSNAKTTAQQFGAKYATTDYEEILGDKDIDAVFITTRHNLHAKMAMAALRAGKAVFLEKPMALNKEELDGLITTIHETQKPFMVGFNRRFSKFAREAKKQLAERINPMIINYQMNAGYIPYNHWVHTEEGGGRIIGEACHIFDLFNYFIDAEVESIFVEKITPKTEYYSAQDNIVVTLKYKDGSVCTLTYTGLGSNQYPKEFCQIYNDGKIIIIDDYRSLEGYGLKLKKIKSTEPGKGRYEELVEFANYLKGNIQPPIPLWQLIQATEISFMVDESL